MNRALLATVLVLGAAFSAQAKDIVNTAVSAASFKTLATDIVAVDGVMHAIDGVVMPK